MLLTEDTYLLFAAQAYNNPSCVSTEEFIEDVKRIKYLKKLFGQYKKTGLVNERLIMNHMIILYNVFSPRECTKMLFFKLEEHWDCLKPFILGLNYLPSFIEGIRDDGGMINTDAIIMDFNIANKVKNLLKEEENG